MPAVELLRTHPDWRESARTDGAVVAVRGAPADTAALDAALAADDPRAAMRIGGHWTAVVRRGESTLLVQDLVRSFPLFYETDATGTIRIADDIEALLAVRGAREVDAASAEEFRRFGYVTGAPTLFTGIDEVQAAEWVRLDGSRISRGFGSLLRYSGTNLVDAEDLDARFDEGFGTTMDRLLARLDGRQVVVPLSGGLDSRLLSAALRERGYDRVLNFTYGIGPTSEVRISERVAAQLHQPWEFVEYRPDRIRELWRSPENVPFLAHAYAGTALPHIQDWLAVHDLRESGAIDDDAVFLPGHTVVGNTHDTALLLATDSVSRARMIATLMNHHDTLQPDRRAALPRATAGMSELLDQLTYDGTPRARSEAMENWNLRERQTKYINHSMRNYEHFGYEWALPMLEPEVFDAWSDFSPAITRDRAWYHGYVNRLYTRLTGDKLDTFTPTAVPAGVRRLLKAGLRATGLLGRAERVAAARATANHPMAFEAFAPDGDDIGAFVRQGGTALGLFANAFLKDRWNPHTSFFRG